MRTLNSWLDEYQESHQNPLNSLIHMFCVPAIFFSTLGLLWAVPIGHWLGLPAPWDVWVNGSALVVIPGMMFYCTLSMREVAVMFLWFLLTVAGILAIQASGLSLVITCAMLWGLAWVLQLYGHKVEGAKPSFAKDLLFLLVGPLFVMDKVYRKLGRLAA